MRKLVKGGSSNERAFVLQENFMKRMQTGSLIITSQFPTEHWHSMFNDATLAEAILDRIVHRSHRIGLKGESLRKQAAKA